MLDSQYGEKVVESNQNISRLRRFSLEQLHALSAHIFVRSARILLRDVDLQLPSQVFERSANAQHIASASATGVRLCLMYVCLS